jgi:hypothetical protein
MYGHGTHKITIYSGWTASTLKTGYIGSTETSVTNYQTTLRNFQKTEVLYWKVDNYICLLG